MRKFGLVVEFPSMAEQGSEEHDLTLDFDLTLKLALL